METRKEKEVFGKVEELKEWHRVFHYRSMNVHESIIEETPSVFYS